MIDDGGFEGASRVKAHQRLRGNVDGIDLDIGCRLSDAPLIALADPDLQVSLAFLGIALELGKRLLGAWLNPRIPDYNGDPRLTEPEQRQVSDLLSSRTEAGYATLLKRSTEQ